MSTDFETTLLVVPNEAAVRYARECGRVATTRDALFARLLAALAPEVSVASGLAARLALDDALLELAATEDWLHVLAARGGRAWMGVVDAVGASLAEARRSTWLGLLLTEQSVANDPRARVLVAAGRLLDAKLARVGLVDPADREGAVARALAGAAIEAVVSAVGALRILAVGIASWWPADLALWRALDARLSLAGGAARIELATFDRRLDAALAPDPLGRLIDAVAEAIDDAPETRPIAAVLGDFTFTGELGAESRSRVEVRQADSQAAQARAILDAVEDALSGGASPEQIAIVVPDTEARHTLEKTECGAVIARALAEAEVPSYASVRVTNPQAGLTACALEALVVAEERVPRLGLAALLRSPYLDARRLTGLGGEKEARVALERLAHVLETTPTATGDGPEDSLARTVLAARPSSSTTREELADMAALVRRVAEPFARMSLGAKSGDHAAHAKRLFQALGLTARPSPAVRAHLAQDAPAEGIATAELLAFARDARAGARLYATLDAYEGAMAFLRGETSRGSSSFRLELERDLAMEDEGSLARAVGAVRIGTLRELAGRPLALLILADAHDGSLDAPPEGVGLFDADVEARLTEAIEPALRASVLAARAADRVRLASAAAAATRVVITYAVHDEAGGLSSPHPLVAWLEREGVKTSVWRDKVVVDRPLTVHEDRLSRLATTKAARMLHPRAAERAAVEARREAAFGGNLAAEAAMSPEVKAILTEETGGGDRPMSVTSLDRFGACLFQGFAAQVLRARKTEARAEIVDAREEGTLLHAALAAAFAATRELWVLRPRDAERIRAMAREAATELLARSPSASLLRRAAQGDIGESVMKVVEWSLTEEEWNFSHAEPRFGMSPGSWDTVVLDDGRTALRLSGSVDRVDVAHKGAGLRVVDYKRGEEGARRLTSELGETSFQLAVYARAASVALGVSAGHGVYLPTRRLAPTFVSNDSAAAWERAHALEGDVPRFARRALDLARRVRSGDLEARPATPDTCRVCDHDGVCRKPRFVIVSALEDGQEETRDGG